jgi:hypothetical protein
MKKDEMKSSQWAVYALNITWPGIARTIWVISVIRTYFTAFPGKYFTE